ETVKAIQTDYQADRKAADGLVKKFSPEPFDRATAFAKQGAAALKANRLIEARDSFRRARWSLPSLPASLPPHVARILGDGRLRHGGVVNALAFNKAGTRLVTAGAEGTVKVWDAATGPEGVPYAGHTDAVRAVAFSHDGKFIASGGADKEIRIWEAETGKDVKPLTGHTEAVSGLAFSPDGKLLAAAGLDKQVRIYDIDGAKV